MSNINEKEEKKQKDRFDSIKKLTNHTDEPTKEMLMQVVKRQDKYLSYKQKHMITMICLYSSLLFYLIYLYNGILKPNAYSFGDIFHVMINDSISSFVLLIIFGIYATMDYLYKKREKAEKEFHALRCEIIDKSTDLWKSEEKWQQRGVVFEMMRNTYDVNLYHENK